MMLKKPRMSDDLAELDGRWTRRRRAQARRFLHHRARPLSHRQRRSRRGAAPPRRGAMVEPGPRATCCSGASSGHSPSPAISASRRRCCLPDGALPGARLDRRRAAAYRQAAWRCRLFPLRQGGAARAASCRHRAQRSRQGAELALRRRSRLSDRLSARRHIPPRQPRYFASRATRTCGICSSTNAVTRPRR